LKLFIFLFIAALSAAPPVKAQNKTDDIAIVKSFDDFKGRFIHERLYVHTDEDVYISRQTLWFRIYYINAVFNRTENLSQIAYLEVLDKNNVPVVQQKVSLKPGESNGSFLVPADLTSGYYSLRAYTSWMKNFDPEYFFEKKILIINPGKLHEDSSGKKDNLYDMQFFPEGGNLVQKIRTKVGFRITDNYGHGLNATGTLTNSKGDTVLRFLPKNLGLGNFLFIPETNMVYTAHVVMTGGEITKKLPPVYSGGYVLNLTRTTEDEISVRIAVSPDLEKRDVFLFIHGRFTRLPVKKIQIAQDSVVFTINQNTLEEGISKFTLFDDSGRPVCERLFYRYPQNRFSILPVMDTAYKTRQRVDISLNTMDSSGNNYDADMSLAVYRLDDIHGNEQADINTYLNLTSEIGAIESPSFYFREDGSSKQDDMDNLMLTHGWRRFRWQEISDPKSLIPSIVPDHNTHIIRGKLIDEINGRPVSGERVYLSIPSTRTQFRSTVSDEQGRIKFDMKDFYGSKEIIVQARENNELHYRTEIENPFSDNRPKMKFPEFNMTKSNLTNLVDRELYIRVQHIYNESALNHYKEQVVDTNPFYVVPDEKYLLDDYTRFITMEEVLREYVRSLNVVRKGDKFALYLLDNATERFFPDPPLILIDGVPFFDANELFHQDPKYIKRLDLINRKYLLGNEHFSGVISLTTYHGDLNGIQLNKHAIVLDYPGIPSQREFFSPEYITEQQITDRMPDFRSLLYWSPRIQKDEKEKYKTSFYTSDLPGNYVVVVQGLTISGVPLSKTAYFKVKK
jgi:hypothetical protein